MIFVGLVVLALVVLSGVVIMNRGAAQETRLADAREEGLNAHSDGDYETALSQLSSYLSKHSDDVEALVAFADARSKLPVENNRHTVEAMGLYRAVLEIEPNHLEAMSSLMLLNEQVGRWVEAQDLAERILQSSPDHIDALRLRALSAYRETQYTEAQKHVERLIEVEPKNTEWRAMYLQLLRAQNRPLDEMLAICTQWDEQFEGDGRYRLMMAELHVYAGQREEAERAARQAAARGASESRVLQRMVAVLDTLRMRDTASELIQTTTGQFPAEFWPYEANVRRHWQNNRIDEALESIESAVMTLGEPNQDLLQWRALLLIMLDRENEASETVARLEELLTETDGRERDERQAWIAAMQARLNKGDVPWRKTRDAYRMAVSLAPRDPVLQFLLGEAYMEIGEYDLAIRSLEMAQRSDPHWLAARVAHAEALLLAGHAQRSLEHSLELIQRVESPGMTAYLILARSWLASGRAQEGIGLRDSRTGNELQLLDLLQSLYDSSPENSAIRELLARAAAQGGEQRIVVDVVNDAIRQQSPSESHLLSLASISHRHGIDVTDSLLDRAREVHGLTVSIAETIANIYHDRGRSEEGLALLRRAINESGAGDEVYHQRVLAGYLARIEHPDAPKAMEALLDRGDQQVGSFILSYPTVWRDGELTKRALEQFTAYVGEDSPRVVFARANYMLRHEPENEAGLAEVQLAVNEVLQRMPDSLPALNLMTQLALHGDEPNVERAIRHLQQAIRHHPHEPDLYFRLIPLLQQQGDFASAEQYLERLRGIRIDDPEYRRAELDMWHAQGNFDEVIGRLSETIDASSPESDRLVYLAHLHRAGRLDEADQHLQDILDDPDRSDAAILVAAQIYADRGRIDEAIDLIDHSEPEGGDVARAILRGRVHQHIGRLEEAREHYHRALELDERNVDAITFLVGVELGLGESRRAFELARRGLRLDPENNALRSSIVMSAMALGPEEQDEAMQLVDDIEAESSALAETLRMYRQISTPDGGLSVSSMDLDDLRQLTYDFPRFMPAWRLAILAHVEGDERGEAIRLARQAAARLPHLADPPELAAQLLVQEDRLREALEMARMWRERSRHRPRNADVLIASILLDLEQPEEAYEQIQPHGQNLVTDAARDPTPASIVLQSLMRSGRIPAAHDQFRSLLRESSEWRDLWLEISTSLDRADARQALTIAEDAFHDDAGSRMNLAVALATIGQHHDAPELLERSEREATAAAEASDSLREQSLLLRGQVAEARHEFDRSIALYREVLSLNPDHAVALNNLAYRLLDDERNCTEAAELAAKAIELLADVPEVMNTHALAHLCTGDPSRGEEFARKAIAQRPDDSAFHLTLGLTLAEQERWDEARDAIAEVERLMTDESSMSPTFRERLARLREQLNRHAAVETRTGTLD